MKIPQHLMIYLCFLIGLFCFPVLGNTTIENQNNIEENPIPLSEAIDEVADVYQVNIVYDVEQIANKEINDWSIQYQSVEAELKELYY